jgi:phage FluMu protein Com
MVQPNPPPPTVQELRCWRCNRKLAEIVSSPWRIKCPRCKASNQDLRAA